MDTTTTRRKKLIPILQSTKNRILFKVINIYLVIGMGSLLITMFYLTVHLYEADKVIMRCIPGFIMGISSGLIYLVGYQSMISEQKGNSPYLPLPFNGRVGEKS
jgi:hypothetical protein